MKCPHCKTTITMVIEWQTCSVGYLRSLDKDDDFISNLPEIIGGDYENISCPNCKETLPDGFGNYGQ